MRIALITLGCAKNQTDSERLAAMLVAAGHLLVEETEGADIVVLNTCGFIDSAIRESVDALLDLERMKEEGRIGRIAAVGCLVNRFETELRKELPAVDFWTRAEGWAELLGQMGHGTTDLSCIPAVLPGFSRWSRFLKIAEGCDNRCSYCTIPSIRGPLRSRSITDIVREAEAFVREGAREICLVAQDITAYGFDVERTLPELVGALSSALPRDLWLRLLYMHPKRVTPRLWEQLLAYPQVLPYADVPLQHADPMLLAAMNRPDDPGRVRDALLAARQLHPDFALRTTFIVGFPGEDDEAFENLLRFNEEQQFDRMGAFIYSPEEGTTAAALPLSVPPDVAQARLERLLHRQEAISRERGERFVGRVLRVLVESVDESSGTAWGRSFRDAPEVDGGVEIEGGALSDVGAFVEVRITGAEEHDLFGEKTS